MPPWDFVIQPNIPNSLDTSFPGCIVATCLYNWRNVPPPHVPPLLHLPAHVPLQLSDPMPLSLGYHATMQLLLGQVLATVLL